MGSGDRWLVVGVVAALAVTACSGDDAADTTGATTTTTASVPPMTAEASTGSSDDGASTADSSPDTSDTSDTSDSGTTADVVGTTEPTAIAARDFSAVGPIVQAFVDEHGLNGAGLVVVDRDDGIVDEEYFGEFGADRVSLLASSSKMITAGVLLRLQDDGLIDLDAPIVDVVPWGAGNPEITAAQLISNSSGLVGLGPDPTYGPYLCQFLPGGDIEECAASIFETPDDDADVIPPDTEFRYGGAQWQVAGAVAEEVSGKPWAQLIDEIYVQPCGVESLGYGNHWAAAGGFDYPVGFDPANVAPTENPSMEGGAFADPLDYAALLLMHLRGGLCGDQRVLSSEAVALAHTDRVGDVYGDAGAPDTGYGMGWWIDRGTGYVSDAGAYGAVPWLDEADGYGAYLVLEADGRLGPMLAAELQPVVDEVMTGG